MTLIDDLEQVPKLMKVPFAVEFELDGVRFYSVPIVVRRLVHMQVSERSHSIHHKVHTSTST